MTKLAGNEKKKPAGSLFRVLDNFVFYDTQRLEMVPFADLLGAPNPLLDTVAVVGEITVLKPYDLDPVDEDDDELVPPDTRDWTAVKITGIKSIVPDYSGMDPKWVHATE